MSTGLKAKSETSRRKGESKHSPRRIASAHKQVEALEYRKMGLTYAQVAEKLELNSPQAAWYCCEAAMKATLQEPADHVRKLELARLDAMFISVYGNACRGDLMAITAAMNIMTRRARLLGLDAPVKTENKTELNNPGGAGVMVIGPVMSPEEWAPIAQAQQAALIANRSPTTWYPPVAKTVATVGAN